MLIKNGFGKYMIYAIGEIFLVVIGIYIAIQFNNWNIANQNKVIASNNIELLINSLVKDSITLKELQVNIEKGKTTLSNYAYRLIQPTCNFDTLVKIARFEFRPGVNNIRFDNDNTYEALIQSGEINLLNRELKNELFTLYSLHKISKESNDVHFNTYLDWLTKFRSKYPSRGGTFGEGPINEVIWQNATLIELASTFSAVINSKRNHYRLNSRYLNQLIRQTNNVLVNLKEAKR